MSRTAPVAPAPRPKRTAGSRAAEIGSRDRIHDAALELFAERGYDGVGLQAIADAAGLHKSSLFHHYRSKLVLAHEVYGRVLEGVLACIEPLAKRREPALEHLLAAAETLVDHFCDRPQTARMLLSFSAAPMDSDLRQPVDADHPEVRFYQTVWDWLERAKAAGAVRTDLNVRQAIFNLVGLVIFYPAMATPDNPLSGPDPFSSKARRIRKQELRHTLHGMFAP
ncbi:MAG: TetR/AcrR family transcriptional regulator [Myxococcota bacterium]